jgi:CspA family cold shock protein
MKGTIKVLKADKGFGFITPADGGKDVFFHSNSLVGVQFAELHEGDAVTFETEQAEKNGEMKTNAINVKRA